MSATLSNADLLSRAPVWLALSHFWLDTELQDSDFDDIARVFAESPYSIDEIRLIHHFEVAPAVSGNLASIAGEWAGFDSEWLNQRCALYAAKRDSLFFKLRIGLQRPLFSYFTNRYWREIIPRVNARRATHHKRNP